MEAFATSSHKRSKTDLKQFLLLHLPPKAVFPPVSDSHSPYTFFGRTIIIRCSHLRRFFLWRI